jgi:hypothetical protein
MMGDGKMVDQSKAWGALQNMADNSEKYFPDRPDKGKHVKVIRGRKHKGKAGVIFWHGRDKYVDNTRYCGNGLQAAMTQLIGIYGYRVGVVTEENERFFVPADYVKIIKVNDNQ